MQLLLSNHYQKYHIGASAVVSAVLHVAVIFTFLVFARQSDMFYSSMNVERSAMSLSFSKPQPVFEKKPIEKLVKPAIKKPVIQDKKLAKLAPKTEFKNETVVEKVVNETVVSKNIQKVSNDAVISDATFKGKRKSPEYPDRAKKLGLEGKVVVKALIDIDGAIEDVQVLESSGYKILDRAVTKVAWKWEFEPSYRNGIPAKQWVKAPYEFVIR